MVSSKRPPLKWGDGPHEDGGEGGAAGHVLPEGLEHDGEAVRVVFYFLEELEEGIAREEADVLGEHGKEAALEEASGDFGVVAVLVEGFGEFREGFGHLTGDGGGVFGGIEGMGISPDAAEAVADFRAVEIREGDAVEDGIGEAFVLPAGAGELGVEVDGVADIADDEEGRTALGGGEGGDIFPGLVVGAGEDFVEGGGAAFAVAGFLGGGACGPGGGDEVEEGAGFGGFEEGALFGFKDEAAGFVEIEVAAGGGAVGFLVGDGAFEDVAVFGVVGAGGFRVRDVEDLTAEFREEEGVVGFFGAAGFFPTGDEGSDGFGGWIRHWLHWNKFGQDAKAKCWLSVGRSFREDGQGKNRRKLLALPLDSPGISVREAG